MVLARALLCSAVNSSHLITHHLSSPVRQVDPVAPSYYAGVPGLLDLGGECVR